MNRVNKKVRGPTACWGWCLRCFRTDSASDDADGTSNGGSYDGHDAAPSWTRWPWLWGRRVQVSCCSVHGGAQGQWSHCVVWCTVWCSWCWRCTGCAHFAVLYVHQATATQPHFRNPWGRGSIARWVFYQWTQPVRYARFCLGAAGFLLPDWCFLFPVGFSSLEVFYVPWCCLYHAGVYCSLL